MSDGDVERERRDAGEMRATWRSTDHGPVGVSRIEVDPGARSTPVHVHSAEEELYYVLGGSDLAWQDGAAHEIFVVLDGAATLEFYANDGELAQEHPLRPGDVVRRPLGRPRLAHTLRAADDADLTYLF